MARFAEGQSDPLQIALEGLADVNPLAVACDLVGLIGIDGVCARAAVDGVLDGGDVPGLEEVAAATAVEAVHRGVAPPDQVVRAAAAVDGIGPGPVAKLVLALTASDEIAASAAVELVASAEAEDPFRLPRAPEYVGVVGARDRVLVGSQGHAGRERHHEGCCRQYHCRTPHLLASPFSSVYVGYSRGAG